MCVPQNSSVSQRAALKTRDRPIWIFFLGPIFFISLRRWPIPIFLEPIVLLLPHENDTMITNIISVNLGLGLVNKKKGIYLLLLFIYLLNSVNHAKKNTK